jgi:hypothetical protein
MYIAWIVNLKLNNKKQKEDNPNHQGKNVDPQSSSGLDVINSVIDSRISKYKERLKYFFLGFTCIFLFLLSVDLISKRQIIRELHEIAFPTKLPPVSYSSTFVIKVSDTSKRNAMMAFYATRGQYVQVYLAMNQRFIGEGDKLPINTSIDGKIIGSPTLDYSDKFVDISGQLDNNLLQDPNKLNLGPKSSVHHIGFSLASEPNQKQNDIEIAITCIIHVFEIKP